MPLLTACRQLLGRLFARPERHTAPARRRARPGLEGLERREVPATLIGANRVSYQDVDGDTVTVTLSRGLLTAGNVNTVFTFNTGTVNGDNSVKQQLQRIDLTGLGASAAGVAITTGVRRGAVTGGDGLAALGEINATGIDLGVVNVRGDLGRVVAGDANTLTPGSRGLIAFSMGRYGTSTGAANLTTTIQGRLDLLQVRTDIKEASILVQGGADGRIGPITVGGSLIGGAAADSGLIRASGALGVVKIGGNLRGGDGDGSGGLDAGLRLAGLTVGGSLIGGLGVNSGSVMSGDSVGLVRVIGNLQGGVGDSSGAILSFGAVRGATVGGSLLGGAGDNSGSFQATGVVGAVTVAGNVQGGSAANSGMIRCDDNLSSLTVRGSLIGGAGEYSGGVQAAGFMQTLRVTGDVRGGTASGADDLNDSGSIFAGRIANLTVGGSVFAGVDGTTGQFFDNGSIKVLFDIGAATIGNLIGNDTNAAVILAYGSIFPTATRDLAIGRLTVRGRVEFARILAGFEIDETPLNADAQIGPVTVGGDWIASSIAAGAVAGADAVFGTADDAKMAGVDVLDEPTISSRIVSLSVGGQMMGTVGGTDQYGIVTENIGSLRIGGTLIPLTVGNGNDDLDLGITGDLTLREV